jgi:maleate cis-trans isomerase
VENAEAAMDAIAEKQSPADRPLVAPRARVGLIVPSVNRMSEPQFNHFAPPGLGIHVARARITGQWRRPAVEMRDEITRSATALADSGPDLIVYHCTDSSMREGRAGERTLIDIVRAATGIDTVATSALVIEALRALGIGSVVLLSPYLSNDVIVRYLAENGIAVKADVALKLNGHEFAAVTPRRWLELAREHDRPDADGIFLSCTNTTQIEAIEDIERALGKPVVNSNQAVLWGCVKRLGDRLETVAPAPRLGRLMAV